MFVRHLLGFVTASTAAEAAALSPSSPSGGGVSSVTVAALFFFGCLRLLGLAGGAVSPAGTFSSEAATGNLSCGGRIAPSSPLASVWLGVLLSVAAFLARFGAGLAGCSPVSFLFCLVNCEPTISSAAGGAEAGSSTWRIAGGSSGSCTSCGGCAGRVSTGDWGRMISSR